MLSRTVGAVCFRRNAFPLLAAKQPFISLFPSRMFSCYSIAAKPLDSRSMERLFREDGRKESSSILTEKSPPVLDEPLLLGVLPTKSPSVELMDPNELQKKPDQTQSVSHDKAPEDESGDPRLKIGLIVLATAVSSLLLGGCSSPKKAPFSQYNKI